MNSTTFGKRPIAALIALALIASIAYAANSSREDLTILRGNVEADGSISAGRGFTVLRESQGTYLITFTRPYKSTPTIVATLRKPCLPGNCFGWWNVESIGESSARIRTWPQNDDNTS
ncbi:hypothetical protein HY256_12675, partial [Candidatus Sumerlaeota bacterium]|nr:hypothetical protein [Candidatus Sumerlaeota bacterium]